MLYCGDCGGELTCEKNGAKIFSTDLKFYCRTDAFRCKKCDTMILTGHSRWSETPIEEINLKERYDVSLHYDHYSSIRDHPVCADCFVKMEFMGDGILLLSDEHAHQEGKMWVCPFCDYIYLHRKHTSWPPPLTLDEKRELEKKYAPNMLKIGEGVIMGFRTIKEAEDREGLDEKSAE